MVKTPPRLCVPPIMCTPEIGGGYFSLAKSGVDKSSMFELVFEIFMFQFQGTRYLHSRDLNGISRFRVSNFLKSVWKNQKKNPIYPPPILSTPKIGGGYFSLEKSGVDNSGEVGLNHLGVKHIRDIIYTRPSFNVKHM